MRSTENFHDFQRKAELPRHVYDTWRHLQIDTIQNPAYTFYTYDLYNETYSFNQGTEDLLNNGIHIIYDIDYMYASGSPMHTISIWSNGEVYKSITGADPQARNRVIDKLRHEARLPRIDTTLT